MKSELRELQEPVWELRVAQGRPDQVVSFTDPLIHPSL